MPLPFPNGRRGRGTCSAASVPFHLRRRTGERIHTYQTEGAALVFVRDVIRVNGHQAAAQFALDSEDEQGQTRVIAEGMALVRRALQDWEL